MRKAIILLTLAGALAVPAVASAKSNVSYSEARSLSIKNAKRVAFRFDAEGWTFRGCVRRSNINLLCRVDFHGFKSNSGTCRAFWRIYAPNIHSRWIYSDYVTGNCRG